MNHSTQGKATVLAIGTELTTGQIINRNAAWISEKLIHLGIEVLFHHTVPDDYSLIRQALDHCKSQSQLIFVTGGLGPTTDDFTRNVVADWLERPLEFQKSIWSGIQNRLHSLGIPVADSNKQQCYFPQGADILPNPQGTAAGFTSPIGNTKKRIWVLPGPPNEVSSVWNQGIEKSLKEIVPPSNHQKLFTWQCMGKSEAEFGEITENALSGSQLKTGYRAQRPIVEIKVWCPETDLPTKMPWIKKLETTLAPWILTQQGEDLAIRLLEQLKRSEEVTIIDSASAGILSNRLCIPLRQAKYQELCNGMTLVTEWKTPSPLLGWIKDVLEQADEDSITLVLGTGIVGIRDGARTQYTEISTPYSLNLSSEEAQMELQNRARHFLVEIALKKWCEWLTRTEN